MANKVINLTMALCLSVAARCGGAAVLQGDSSQPTGRFGDAASELEDSNGDGRWEFLVGAPQLDVTGANDGRVYLWYGGTGLTAAANREFSGNLNEQFGFAVGRVGDVNGDGDPDFAVGAPRYSQAGTDRGRVYLFFGGPGLDETADAILEAPDATSGPQFGFAVSAAGDFNGDGRDDLIVGAPFDDSAGLDTGSAYVFYGSGSVAQLQTADLSLRGALAQDHFGWSVSDGGSLFRDGVASVVVGAPANSDAITREGTVVIFRGASSPTPGPDATSDLTLTSSSGAAHARNWFGYAVRGLGDWDHDGDDDLAVGAPRDDTRGLDAGRVEIFLGGFPPPTTSARYANGQDGADLFGWALADLGEATGDNRTDLLIGAPGVAAPAAGAGRAYLFAGGGASADSPAELARTIVAEGVNPNTEADDAFGTCVAAAGDLDGDGQRDFAVGAPTGNVANNAEAGYARLYDSSGDVVPTLLRAWSASWTGSGEARLVFTLADAPSSYRALTLWREIVPADGGAPYRVTACAGELGAGTLPLTFAGEQWVLGDRPGAIPARASLRYALGLFRVDGGEVVLDGLAGPPALDSSPLELRLPTPNPFNPRTAIVFRAPAGAAVTCRVFDLQGRLVADLPTPPATGAWQTVIWNGRGRDGPASAGVYAIRVATASRVRSRLVALAK